MAAVEKYFNSEKLACSFGILLGVLSLAAAVYFFVSVKKPFYSGMAWPLMVCGLFFFIICIAVVIRSPKDIQRVNQYIQSDRPKVKTEEIPRMEKVIQNFGIIIIVEGICIIIGLLLFFLLPDGSFLRGLGVTLMFEAAFLLVFDILARIRAKEYFDYLLTL